MITYRSSGFLQQCLTFRSVALSRTVSATISLASVRRRNAYYPICIPTTQRYFSLDHLTQEQLQLDYEHTSRKAKPSSDLPKPIVQEKIEPQVLSPHVYCQKLSSWVATDDGSQGLDRGSSLKVVSWNLQFDALDPAARASAAVTYLSNTFGEESDHLVIMLQEVNQQSLQAILDHAWVQRNFLLSNIEPPKTIIKDISDESSVFEPVWVAASYFTLMLISKDLSISKCFRAPFTTAMGRDALVTDIPILGSEASSSMPESLRLCTTHLESLYSGKDYRLGQLALVSALLKGASALDSRIIGGLVGGDMNPCDRLEHDYHRATEVDLKDVWEDEPVPPPPVLKPFQKDTTYGRARGNTWGYQSKARTRNRMDKFLYTGSVETFAVDEAQDVTGRLGRLGIGLKVEVDAWKYEMSSPKIRYVRGKAVETPSIEYVSEEGADILRELEVPGSLTRGTTEAWISDHFGIVVGIRVP